MNTNIPWYSQEEWDQVLLSIKQAERLNSAALIDIHKVAAKIRRCYESLSESIAIICSHTCMDCRDICSVIRCTLIKFKI
ncbi:MAG: hypothetical protein ABIJ59_12030 [Pseudomonadota bacterium]